MGGGERSKVREMSSRKMEEGGENVKGRARNVEARIALTFLDSCWGSVLVGPAASVPVMCHAGWGLRYL